MQYLHWVHNEGVTTATAARTQRLIRRAAIELAVEKTVDEVTVDEIAARAGVSRRTVFNHFPSKYDVFIPAISMYPQAALDAFATHTGEPLMESIRRLLLARWSAVDVDLDDLCVLRRIGAESAELRTAFKESIESQQAALVAAVARRIDEPEDSLDALALSSAIHGIEHTVLQYATGQQNVDPEDMSAIVDRVLRAWTEMSAVLAGRSSPGSP